MVTEFLWRVNNFGKGDKESNSRIFNDDRQQAGLNSVQISLNEAAQKHAEDIPKTRYLSHWTTDGMKPYMRYTIYNGIGAVGQNAAISGYAESSIQQCQIGLSYCPTLDVEKEIKDAEYSMMYDDASSNWGHRDNILDKDHTHVSIGVASDGYTFAFVQNFENHFFADEEKTNSGYNVRIYGTFIESQKNEAKTINVYFDPLPTPATYEQNKSRNSYDQGEFAGFVTPPLSPRFYYTGDDLTVSATNWQANSYWVDISFNLQQFYQKEGPGVYTIYLIVGDLKDDNSLIQATSYSVFLQ
ncbi:MAG: CAP domain-containing protein [Nitrososphaera sp.]